MPKPTLTTPALPIRDQALPCHSQPQLFHAPDDGRADNNRNRDRRIAAAIELCLDCPLMLACREAGRQGREWGVWGAETEEERAAAGYPPVTRAKDQPDCGTEAAARWHRRNEPGVLCAPCLAAESEVRRQRRAQREEAVTAQWPPTLSPQEQQALELIAAGGNRDDIQVRFGLTRRGANGVLYKLRKKLRTDTDKLVAVGRQLGLIPATAKAVDFEAAA